jgi:hypothetical protein
VKRPVLPAVLAVDYGTPLTLADGGTSMTDVR